MDASPAPGPPVPREEDLLSACVHVGFCLPACPTYLLWGEEMDSPRGRITLMEVAAEPEARVTDEMVLHWDRCLGCMACVTACPAGVRYDRLIESTRALAEQERPRPLGERLLRRLAFAVFTHPGRLRALAPLLAAYRRLGGGRLLEPLAGRVPALRTLLRLVPPVGAAAALRRLPAVTQAAGPPRGRVGLLQGCVQRVFFHDVNAATARVLAAEGFEVVAPSAPRCCGALLIHSGLQDEARPLVASAVESFAGCDLVAVNAAGCGSSMKEYGFLFSAEEGLGEAAAELAGRVRDVTELLAAVEPRTPRHPVPLRAVYHDACHLAHAQGIRSQPRELLRAVPGLELLEPEEWEICCGSAGVYNLLQPEAAAELGRRKAARLLETGAEAVIAANPGCALQIAAHLEELGHPLPVHHPIEILDRSIRGG